jgi:hypothetical protein
VTVQDSSYHVGDGVGNGLKKGCDESYLKWERENNEVCGSKKGEKIESSSVHHFSGKKCRNRGRGYH